MVEKAKDWLGNMARMWPVIAALVWLIFQTATFHQQVIDQLKTEEDQIMQMQDYLKHDHEKGSAQIPYSGISSDQVLHPQDAQIPINP